MKKKIKVDGEKVSVSSVTLKVKAKMPGGKDAKAIAVRRRIVSEAISNLDKIYCPALKSYVHYNSNSFREIKFQAAKSRKSVLLALNIEDLVARATFVKSTSPKNNKGQRDFDVVHFLAATVKGIGIAKIVVGENFSKDKKHHYSVTAVEGEGW